MYACFPIYDDDHNDEDDYDNMLKVYVVLSTYKKKKY